jgi:hypothetical protein
MLGVLIECLGVLLAAKTSFFRSWSVQYELGRLYPIACFFTYTENVAHAHLTVSRARMEDVRTWERLPQV